MSGSTPSELCEANLGLIHSEALRWSNTFDVDELVQEGALALMLHSDKWIPDRGKYSTFATNVIRNWFRNLWRMRNAKFRQTIPLKGEIIDNDSEVVDDFDMTPYNERERLIIKMLMQGVTVKSIAKVFGVAPHTVSMWKRTLKAKIGVHHGHS